MQAAPAGGIGAKWHHVVDFSPYHRLAGHRAPEAAAGGPLQTELCAARRGGIRAPPMAEGASSFCRANKTVVDIGGEFGGGAREAQDTAMWQTPERICSALSFLSRLLGPTRLRPTTLSFRCHRSRLPLGNCGAFARGLFLFWFR